MQQVIEHLLQNFQLIHLYGLYIPFLIHHFHKLKLLIKSFWKGQHGLQPLKNHLLKNYFLLKKTLNNCLEIKL